MTAQVADATIRRAYLVLKADHAIAAFRTHYHGCNQCWSALVMPKPGTLCDEGHRLSGEYLAELEVGR